MLLPRGQQAIGKRNGDPEKESCCKAQEKAATNPSLAAMPDLLSAIRNEAENGGAIIPQ